MIAVTNFLYSAGARIDIAHTLTEARIGGLHPSHIILIFSDLIFMTGEWTGLMDCRKRNKHCPPAGGAPVWALLSEHVHQQIWDKRQLLGYLYKTLRTYCVIECQQPQLLCEWA